MVTQKIVNRMRIASRSQRHKEEGKKVVGQGKEVNEEFDHVTQMRAYD